MKAILLLSLLLLSLSLQAFASEYNNFGGSCASLGAWSQAALAETRALEQALQSIHDNPSCHGIEEVVANLKVAEQSLNTPASEKNRENRLESLPNEISSLRSFMTGDASTRAGVAKLLLGRTLEGASMTAELAVAQGVQSLATRAGRAGSVGIDALNQAMATLPSYDQCLVGMPNQGLAVFGAAVKLSAAFASSKSGTIGKMGDSIANLVHMLREKKFSEVMRRLNQSEYLLSMSCLLETASQNYCSADDAYNLLEEAHGQFELNSTHSYHQKGGPLEGYMLTVREVPIVSEWLQKIQFGIQPKLLTDAEFKNNVWDTVVGLTKRGNVIRGQYSEALLTMSTLSDVNSKRNLIFQTLNKLYFLLVDTSGGGSQNFFTTSILDQKIPFYLIGRDQVPTEVSTNSAGSIAMTWEQYLQNGGNFRPEFNDPEALATTIGIRLDTLIEQAEEKASAYFRQRMIADMANLVNESITSQTITVVQSLQNIYSYLGRLAQRIEKDGGDVALIPSLIDTQLKIKRVLNSYSAVRSLAQPTAADLQNPVQYSQKIKSAYQSVIETAYMNFNVLLQRDTFLISRLSTFVRQDYALRLKNQENITPYERDILIVTGKNLMDRLIGVYQTNPQQTALDLAPAQKVNKTNLESIESFFSDSLYPLIEELDLIRQGKQPSDWSLNLMSLMRREGDAIMGTLHGNPFAYLTELLHPDLYPLRLTIHPTKRGVDDEHGSFAQLEAKLCIQTLAFEDRAKFWPVCRDTVLKSYFDSKDGRLGLNMVYDNYAKHGEFQRATNTHNICAFRDFNRKNLVYWLTYDLGQNDPTSGGIGNFQP